MYHYKALYLFRDSRRVFVQRRPLLSSVVYEGTQHMTTTPGQLPRYPKYLLKAPPFG
jgi:hypothetical protein